MTLQWGPNYQSCLLLPVLDEVEAEGEAQRVEGGEAEELCEDVTEGLGLGFVSSSWELGQFLARKQTVGGEWWDSVGGSHSAVSLLIPLSVAKAAAALSVWPLLAR